jgi:flagellar protein FlbD
MIKLHRIRGEEFFLNADLVESVASTPDTVVTLFDGRKVVVAESAEEVVDRIRTFRASVLRVADDLRSGNAELVSLPGGKET